MEIFSQEQSYSSLHSGWSLARVQGITFIALLAIPAVNKGRVAIDDADHETLVKQHKTS